MDCTLSHVLVHLISDEKGFSETTSEVSITFCCINFAELVCVVCVWNVWMSVIMSCCTYYKYKVSFIRVKKKKKNRITLFKYFDNVTSVFLNRVYCMKQIWLKKTSKMVKIFPKYYRVLFYFTSMKETFHIYTYWYFILPVTNLQRKNISTKPKKTVHWVIACQSVENK